MGPAGRSELVTPATAGGQVGPRDAGETSDRSGSTPRARGGVSGEQWVRRLDRDGDGKVSRREWDGPARHFGDFDRNGDGFLSADEAPAGPPQRRP
jgi:hypothetical protein